MGISDAFYGTKMLLNPNIVSNYLERMNGANVELTQSVSQMTGPTVIFMSNDLLQTKRMTIEDLIESSEVSYVISVINMLSGELNFRILAILIYALTMNGFIVIYI